MFQGIEPRKLGEKRPPHPHHPPKVRGEKARQRIETPKVRGEKATNTLLNPES